MFRASGFPRGIPGVPPERNLHGISFAEWIRPFNIPPSLYAFLVSNCCDGMFMVPVARKLR